MLIEAKKSCDLLFVGTKKASGVKVKSLSRV